MSLLAIDGLEVAFGAAHVVRDVNLILAPRERVGIVGESGCGKSLTALAVMGLLPAGASIAGSIRLAGEELIGAPERALCEVRGRRIGMVFQEPMSALNPLHPIGRQVAEGPRRRLGLSRAAAEGRAVRWLERVGLPRPRFSPALFPHQLSGGQRQRVGLAIALAAEPEILIADEPTTALDVTIQAQILDLIEELADERGMALLMISHDLGVIAETTERMLVMYAGRAVEAGPTGAVFRKLAHPYTRSLFRALPQIAPEDGGRRPLAAIPGRVPDAGEPLPGCPFAPRCPNAGQPCTGRFPEPVTFGPTHPVACYYPHHQPA